MEPAFDVLEGHHDLVANTLHESRRQRVAILELGIPRMMCLHL